MEASREQRMFFVLVLLFLGRTDQATESSPQQDLKCISIDEEYMVCDWGSKQKPAGNYSLYYRYGSDEEKQCEIYLQSGGINTGCHFQEIKLFKYFHIYVNTSDGTKVFQKEMLLQNQVKPSPPIDFRFEEESNNQLLLSWGAAKLKSHCLEHCVKYKSNKDKKWQEVKTNDMKCSVASVDPKKLYTFYVRSKVRSDCATTNLWSDPAGPLIWGRNTTSEDDPPVSFWIQRIIIPLGSVVILLLLLLILMRMERVWLVLMPRIPNPRNKFEDLFTAYQGNFSEWAGVSKDAVESFKPNYRESICCVSELFPDQRQLLANINCSVLLLTHYLRDKVGLHRTDPIDLCEENGTLKLLFLVKFPEDSASKFLTPRTTYYICKVERGTPGSKQENSYRAFHPMYKHPPAELLDALRNQCDLLEKNRLKIIKGTDGKKTLTMESLLTCMAMANQMVAQGKASGKSGASSSGGQDDEGQPRKTTTAAKARWDTSKKHR